jgi:hypothetical protein
MAPPKQQNTHAALDNTDQPEQLYGTGHAGDNTGISATIQKPESRTQQPIFAA